MHSKNLIFLFSLIITLILGFKMEISDLKAPTPASLVKSIANNIYGINYQMTTQDGYNMDCLKIIYLQNKSAIGVFHSSKGYSDGYNRLYIALQANQNQKWQIIQKISDRASQGTIFQLTVQNLTQPAYLLAYELQNHEHGNTYSIRYYQNHQHIKSNNFLYEYQLSQKIDSANVKNIGTPSIQSIRVTKANSDPKFNQYYLNTKFHYSPDGAHDYPGYGFINFNPLRDFVEGGKWKGGCKQNYGDWKGSSDKPVLNAMRKIGVTGKIGQRDSFLIESGGKNYRYYFYEANLNSDFNWKNWRIFLYSESDDQMLPINFEFDRVIDVANPHVTIQEIKGNEIILQMSFFLPSQGMQPQSQAKPGEMVVKTKILI